MKLEEIQADIDKLVAQLFRKFGQDTYSERCDLHDIAERLKSLSESHKAEIVEAYEAGRRSDVRGHLSSEDYYQKTYGK